jgi:hypothetical protein
MLLLAFAISIVFRYLQEVDIYERALMLMTKEKPEASWLKRPNGEVHDTSHCFGFLRKK